MSKMFDALTAVQRAPALASPARATAPTMATTSRAGMSSPATRFPTVDMGQEMVRLYHQLDHLLPAGFRTIQFIAARAGEGTSTVVSEFARVAEARFDQRVLVLSGVAPVLSPEPRGGARSAAALDDSSTEPAGPPPDIWRDFQGTYDLVILDSPPATAGANGLGMSGLVDGVVMVVSAGAVRWPVVKRTKDSIEASGGRLLGVVFNRRRYYIPEFVYRQL